MGDIEGARAQLDLLLSGKSLEVNSAGRKVRVCLAADLADDDDDDGR
jgi:hypothetical protein